MSSQVTSSSLSLYPGGHAHVPIPTQRCEHLESLQASTCVFSVTVREVILTTGSWVTVSMPASVLFVQQARVTCAHCLPRDRPRSQFRPRPAAIRPRTQQSQHILEVLDSQGSPSKKGLSQAPFIRAISIPLLQRVSPTKAAQHCSWAILQM